MPSPPTLDDLLGSVVVLRDPHGNQARYVVDHVSETTAICSYVFRGRHTPPVDYRRGDRIEFGTGTDRGWIIASGQVHELNRTGSVAVIVEDVRMVQRRRAYREEVVLRIVVADGIGAARKGRTENLSIGGFAARVEGPPYEVDTEVLVTFAMPERDQVVVPCRKIVGDIQQRFAFLELDRPTEDRFARLVREAELAKRRDGRLRP